MEEWIGTLTGTMHRQGYDIGPYNETFLKKTLEIHCKASGYQSVDEFLVQAANNQHIARSFYDALLIPFSEFFRNPLTFSVLEQIILPKLIIESPKMKRKEIRVWSAACASGQEVYSLAMLLAEASEVSRKKLQYRLFGSDVSEIQIQKAAAGMYNEDALSGLTLKRIKKWFTKQEQTYSVKSHLREHITFSIFDLFNESLTCPPASIFGDFDMVFCANLLFYFNANHQKLILDRTVKCLKPGGFLISGKTEREIILNYGLREAYPQAAIFQHAKL